jgi:hypothetical protein
MTGTGMGGMGLGGNTLRSIAETTLGMSAISKRLEGTTRVNNFIGNVKEQLKMQAKGIMPPRPAPSGAHQLAMLAKKYFLPYEIQF